MIGAGRLVCLLPRHCRFNGRRTECKSPTTPRRHFLNFEFRILLFNYDIIKKRHCVSAFEIFPLCSVLHGKVDSELVGSSQ